MGRERLLRTYGHHRQRRIVSLETADIFTCEDGSRHHVFSTSSSESGLGPSDSLDSADSMQVSCKGRRAKNKALLTLKADEEENMGTKNNKRKRQKQHKKDRLFSTDKDTNSSSDCATPVRKRAMRHALHDISNDCKKKTTKRQPAKRNPPKCKPVPAAKDHSSINFSEFDDYSLVISSSPTAEKAGRIKKSLPAGIMVGTSTPCNADTVRISPGLPTADISYIAVHVECVEAAEHSEKSFPFSDVSPPLPLFHSLESNASVGTDPSFLLSEDEKRETTDDNVKRNLEKLEESFASLWVGGRRLRKRQEHTEQEVSSQEQSAELSSVSDIQSSLVKDDLATECKNRVQKLKQSLIKNALAVSDVSQPDNFDASCSLFSSSGYAEYRSSVYSVTSESEGKDSQLAQKQDNFLAAASEDSGDSDGDAQGSDLSAIVEDREDEEGENSQETESDDTETGDKSSDVEAKKTCSTLQESVNEGSPVRYMLTSLSSVDDLEDGEDEEGESTQEAESDDSEVGDNSSDVEVNHTSLVLQESVNEASPVRYMLTSPSSADGLADVSVMSEGDSSILNSKRSTGANLTRSFAEVLSPAKAKRADGEELSPLQMVLQQCSQEEPLPFSAVIPACTLKKCVKIGEGVYGEVFRTKHRGQSVALKIIPIEGDFEVNDEPQKDFKAILPEIVISNELSKLRETDENNTPNFCPLKSVSLVQGRYPAELLKQWDIFNERKNSENDRPDMFGDDQLYIMFEFGDGGCDLDGFKLKNAAQAVSVLQQVAGALAVAEQVLHFEHRDLHVGNILVQATPHSTVTLTLNDVPFFIDTEGILVSIIDFTLSRLTKDGCTVFCDLASDHAQFEGKGDYQFDIYRMMKTKNKNQWEAYHPDTNVMWLHYLCDKLINHKHFQQTDRSHRDSLRRLRQAHSNLLCYSSAAQFVFEDPLFDS